MILAPLLSPFVSAAISLVVGDSSLMKTSFVHGALSILLAVAVSFLAVLPFAIGANPTLELVVSSNVLSVLLSLLVGAAAALSFATGLRDQIAGVAVAIALVPPLASIGIGLRMGDFLFAGRAATVAAINVLAVVISGFVTFNILGLKPSTYYREREAEKMRAVVPAAFVLLALLAAPVAYSSYQGYQDVLVEQKVRNSASDYFGQDLLDVRFRDGTATVVVIGDHNATDFRRHVAQDVDVRLRELRTG